MRFKLTSSREQVENERRESKDMDKVSELRRQSELKRHQSMYSFAQGQRSNAPQQYNTR